jgi:DNA-binding NarL/FixJ family response regulator
MPIRVVVAEDNYLVREAVTRLLDSVDDLEVAGVCGDYDALLAAVYEVKPDVVLTDIRMPPTGTDEGVRAAAELRTTHPDLGVVVLSQYVEPQYALELFDRGSERRAYLLKERVSDVDQLARAVREVAAGGSVIDPKVVEALVARGHSVPTPSASSPRARSARRDGAGRNNASVAGALGLSERAVEKHINSVFSAGLRGARRPPRVKAVLLTWPTTRRAGPRASTR